MVLSDHPLNIIVSLELSSLRHNSQPHQRATPGSLVQASTTTQEGSRSERRGHYLLVFHNSIYRVQNGVCYWYSVVGVRVVTSGELFGYRFDKTRPNERE
jgi:hypothetical protein